MGRAKVMDAHRTIFSMPSELKERVSTYRFTHRIGTEAEALRRLLTEALDAQGIKADAPRKPE